MHFESLPQVMNFFAYVGMKKKFPKPSLVSVLQDSEVIHLTVNYSDLFTITWIGIKNIEDVLRCDIEDDNACERMLLVSHDLLTSEVTSVTIDGSSVILTDVTDNNVLLMADVFLGHIS